MGCGDSMSYRVDMKLPYPGPEQDPDKSRNARPSEGKLDKDR